MHISPIIIVLLKFNFQMADDETESAVVAHSAEEVTVNTVSANEEPMIEIPLMTGSHTLKMRVSLTDFCKLPIRDIGFYNNNCDK